MPQIPLPTRGQPHDEPTRKPLLGRRQFLIMSGGVMAGAGLVACSSTATTAVGPAGPRVDAVEAARRAPGQRLVEARLEPVVGTVDLGNRQVETWSFGGRLPGQEIRVRRGDLLRVDLRNTLPEPTSVHWHGLALRNDMDGVPGLTQAPIDPGAAFRYEFTVPDAGTYFFHPHFGVQLDRGLYSPLIVEDPAEPGGYDREFVVLFDDWLDGSGRDAPAVLADLQANGMNMGGMAMGGGGMPQAAALGGDAGDVVYPDYLANGRTPAAPQVVTARPGDRIRLRMINASGDTAFRVGVPGTTMSVTHTDGFPVQPAEAGTVMLGMGERVDAIVRMPDATMPLLGLAEGKNGLAQVILQAGSGARPDPSKLVSQLMAGRLLFPADLRATEAVTLPQREPDVVHQMKLAGPDPGYRWTINGELYDAKRGVPVREGQRARIRFENTTTMFHPMHLHGHTFQVRSPQGAGPRKDTVTVLPHTAVEVDFDANNPGQWMTHCHNLYHQEAGMATVVSYVA